ncbi:MAG: hypothetical protein ACKVVP_07075 [Chloroflexota bacterium]
MSDETFSRRWLLLSVIGMLTSFLLTIGVAAFGFRGVASADQKPVRPQASAESRPSNSTFLVREIGGNPARTPTATVGTAPTIRETDEPLRAVLRFIQDPGAAMQSAPEPTPEPEPPLPPYAGGRQTSLPEPTARPNVPFNSGGATKTPVPAYEVNGPPVPTSTPVPRLSAAATSPAVTQPSPTSEPLRPTATATPQATVRSGTATPSTAQAPTVSLQVSETRIDSGEMITVTVYATDDEGLDWISWEGVDAGERALDRENRFECGGKKTCMQSWQVRVVRTGTHTIQARSRDSKGLKSEPAFAELRVRTTAPPTVTPRTVTAIPTATPSNQSPAQGSARR